MKRYMIAAGCLMIVLAAGIGFAAGRGRTAGTGKDETESGKALAVEIEELDEDASSNAEEGGVGQALEQGEKSLAEKESPGKEEVLAMRAAALEGMTEEAAERLKENVKVANLQMEEAYLFNDLFGRLSDPEDLYWNYIDEKGEIQIGWAVEAGMEYEGTEETGRREFEETHGTPVMNYNRFDGDNFIVLMEEMRDSLGNVLLKGDFDNLIENMKLAKETHDVQYIQNIYYILHDMDYFLLRYGPEDVGKYVQDGGTVNQYYGALEIYQDEAIEESRDMDMPEAVHVENPSWDYYMETPAETGTEPLELTVLEEAKNEITDQEQWFAENGLELPDLNDEGYFCQINRDRMTVDIIRNGEAEATLDFSDYQYAGDFLPEEKEFIDQEIHSAAVREGILYVSTFHYTYAESSPHTAYITAISLEDYHVLWKTEPLTCNSLNFEIVGDVILCGYGFTAEDDYLYQIDRKTGKRIGQMPLASMADYIIYKDDKLFVRTYHTDYVFQVGGK